MARESEFVVGWTWIVGLVGLGVASAVVLAAWVCGGVKKLQLLSSWLHPLPRVVGVVWFGAFAPARVMRDDDEAPSAGHGLVLV